MYPRKSYDNFHSNILTYTYFLIFLERPYVNPPPPPPPDPLRIQNPNIDPMLIDDMTMHRKHLKQREHLLKLDFNYKKRHD